LRRGTAGDLDDDFDFDFDLDTPDLTTIHRAYEYTKLGSVVRWWLVAVFEEFCCFDREAVGQLPTRFLQDVLEKYRILDTDFGCGSEDLVETQEVLDGDGCVLKEHGWVEEKVAIDSHALHDLGNK
jgi:hypothetical protein